MCQTVPLVGCRTTIKTRSLFIASPCALVLSRISLQYLRRCPFFILTFSLLLRSTMAHPLLSFPFKGVFRIALLICLFHHTIFALTLLPAVAAPHALQPNGVICSPYFGAPLLADCQNAILQHEATISNSPYRLLVSVLGNDNRSENPLLLPRVFYNGMTLVSPLRLPTQQACRQGFHVSFRGDENVPNHTIAQGEKP